MANAESGIALHFYPDPKKIQFPGMTVVVLHLHLHLINVLGNLSL